MAGHAAAVSRSEGEEVVRPVDGRSSGASRSLRPAPRLRPLLPPLGRPRRARRGQRAPRQARRSARSVLRARGGSADPHAGALRMQPQRFGEHHGPTLVLPVPAEVEPRSEQGERHAADDAEHQAHRPADLERQLIPDPHRPAGHHDQPGPSRRVAERSLRAISSRSSSSSTRGDRTPHARARGPLVVQPARTSVGRTTGPRSTAGLIDRSGPEIRPHSRNQEEGSCRRARWTW